MLCARAVRNTWFGVCLVCGAWHKLAQPTCVLQSCFSLSRLDGSVQRDRWCCSRSSHQLHDGDRMFSGDNVTAEWCQYFSPGLALGEECSIVAPGVGSFTAPLPVHALIFNGVFSSTPRFCQWYGPLAEPKGPRATVPRAPGTMQSPFVLDQ